MDLTRFQAECLKRLQNQGGASVFVFVVDRNVKKQVILRSVFFCCFKNVFSSNQA